jgi:hypothetical protein
MIWLTVLFVVSVVYVIGAIAKPPPLNRGAWVYKGPGLPEGFEPPSTSLTLPSSKDTHA